MDGTQIQAELKWKKVIYPKNPKFTIPKKEEEFMDADIAHHDT